MFWGEKTPFETSNRFDCLRANLHVNDNSKMLPKEHPNHDILFKVRPFINAIRENMKKIKVKEFTAVDKIIIPFNGYSSMKQYNKNKPHKWEIKMLLLSQMVWSTILKFMLEKVLCHHLSMYLVLVVM